TDLERRDRPREVERWARGARKVQHRVDGAVDGDPVHHVVFDELELTVLEQVFDVVAMTRREIVDGDHVPSAPDQRAAEMRTDEPGTPGDDGAPHQRPTPWYAN